MVNLAGKLVASRKIFLFYVISFFVLWFSSRISDGCLTKLSEQVVVNHQTNLVIPFTSLEFTQKAGSFLWVIQFLLLSIVFVISRRQSVLDSDGKSLFTETILITTASLNIAVVILLILGANFILNPSKAASVLILLFIIIAAFVITYNVKSEDDESFAKPKMRLGKSIFNRLRNFNFPYFRVGLFLYFVMMLVFLELVRQYSVGWIVVQPIIKLTFFVIVAACILYFLFGLVKNINRMDELQRQIYYEQLFIVFVVLLGLLFCYFAFRIFFQLTLNSQDIMVAFVIAMMISGIFVRAKYQ